MALKRCVQRKAHQGVAMVFHYEAEYRTQPVRPDVEELQRWTSSETWIIE
jgi:hypothetical protein